MTSRDYRLPKTRHELLASQAEALVGGAKRLYVVGPQGMPVKVGIASNVTARVAAIQTAHWATLKIFYRSAPTISAVETERVVHELLAPHRLLGEWFDVTPERAIETIESALANVVRAQRLVA